MLEACRKFGLQVQQDKLQLWSTPPSGVVLVGKHNMKPEACIDFLGTLLYGDRDAPFRHRVTEPWSKFWTLKLALTTTALSLQTRLGRLRAECSGSSLGDAMRGGNRGEAAPLAERSAGARAGELDGRRCRTRRLGAECEWPGLPTSASVARILEVRRATRGLCSLVGQRRPRPLCRHLIASFPCRLSRGARAIAAGASDHEGRGIFDASDLAGVTHRLPAAYLPAFQGRLCFEHGVWARSMPPTNAAQNRDWCSQQEMRCRPESVHHAEKLLCGSSRFKPRGL